MPTISKCIFLIYVSWRMIGSISCPASMERRITIYFEYIRPIRQGILILYNKMLGILLFN